MKNWLRLLTAMLLLSALGFAMGEMRLVISDRTIWVCEMHSGWLGYGCPQ